MADKNTTGSSRNAVLWRASLWSMAGLCVALGAMVWLSGKSETHDATVSGRRLLIHLDNGTIEGKQLSLDAAESPSESPKPKDESPAHSPAESSSPESMKESPKESSKEPVKESAKESGGESHPESTAPESSGESSPAESHSAAAPESMPAESTPAVPSPATALSAMLADTRSIKPATVPLADISEALQEKTSAGVLPMVGPKGLKPWRYYAKPYHHKGHLPTIAILITGLGQNKIVSESAIRLPENFSLSFSPYSKELPSWTNAARIAGHEILLDLPLEPSNFPASDPGPYGLLTKKTDQENAANMQWLMSRTQGYTGFVTPQNESFSSNDSAFKSLLELLSGRGLMVAVEHEPARNDTKKILDASTTPYVIADLRVDEELTANAIQTRLNALEKIASKRGYAVGIAQGTPLTIQQLGEWSAQLEKGGYTLVPVTFITSLKFPS